jgi:hypothetical protein
MSQAKDEIQRQDGGTTSRQQAEQDFIAYVRYLERQAKRTDSPYLSTILKKIVEDVEDGLYQQKRYQL